MICMSQTEPSLKHLQNLFPLEFPREGLTCRDTTSLWRLYLWHSVPWLINIPSLEFWGFWSSVLQVQEVNLQGCSFPVSSRGKLHRTFQPLPFHFAFQICFNKFITNSICNQGQLFIGNTFHTLQSWNHQDNPCVDQVFVAPHFHILFNSTKPQLHRKPAPETRVLQPK